MIDAMVKWIDSGGRPLPTGGPGPFMVTMTAGIGRRGDASADNFEVVVCNAAWLEQRATLGSAFWPRGHLIVDRFDEAHVIEILQQLVETFRRSTDWPAFAERLNRYLRWEREDLDDFQGDVVPPQPKRH